MDSEEGVFVLRRETREDRLVVLKGICIDGSVIPDYRQRLSETDTFSRGAKGGILYGFKREVEIYNTKYCVIEFKGVEDIVFFGRVLDSSEICIEGRIEFYIGNWVVFMYHRGIGGVSDEEFLEIYSLYQQVLPELLERSGIGLRVIPPQQIQE
jgi:hypothetical protein